MYIGVDYYPEHWKRERWAIDAKMMKDAGFNVVRMAEFDWANMEPVEGMYDFSMWDNVLALLAEHGIFAILCTPTASMPAWVARKYPETQATKSDGHKVTWGSRRDNCFSSASYRMLSERITRAMAEHFKDAGNVIGWQTDNELGHQKCYCESCRVDFQEWLKKKYGDLDAFNAAWGMRFWGHQIRAWGEIILPQGGNPARMLDHQRFFSFQNVRFQREQVQILRSVCPKHFVTHNLMGIFKEIDYYEFSEDLDFVSLDNYPIGGLPEVRYGASLGADVMRGVKKKNFWIMEQTAGAPGHKVFGRNPRPGEIRGVAYQQLAHGADGQIWFRWRTCTVGIEQYWHGLLQHDGASNRRLAEAARVAAEYHQLAPLLAGTTVKAEVAMVYDYDSIWATDCQPGFRDNRSQDRMRRYYDALMRAGVSVDIVRSHEDLSAYKLVVAPDLYVVPDQAAQNLIAYVEQGGVLMADCRCAVKDEHHNAHPRMLPGLLAPVFGVKIPEYEAIPEGLTYPLTGEGNFVAEQYCDWLKTTTAEALIGYDQWHLDGCAALTRNASGKGVGWYVGTIVQGSAFYDMLIKRLLADAKVEPVVAPPAGVEATVRAGDGREILFLVNHTEEEKTVAVPRGKAELLTGVATGDSLTLERHGVAVVQLA